jgi:C4-dicarboxylate-specific signal transduction histidine kinase
VDALARRLLDRLQQIGAVVVDIKSRALGDLNALKEHAPVDVPSAARRAVDALAARHSGVEVRVSAPAEGTVALVAGGSTTLERILVNLLDNACAGDGAGHASEVVVSVRSLTDLGLVEVAVDDDGPGFAPEVLSGAHGQGSVKPGGLGVGLSVVRGLVEACGGVVKLANREPRGASVTVRLPAADAD